MDREIDQIHREIVNILFFVHEDNRPAFFDAIAFSCAYTALIHYRQNCEIAKRQGFILDERKNNEHWNSFMNDLNILLNSIGVEVFHANKILTKAKGDNYHEPTG